MTGAKPKVLHTMTWLAKGGGVDNNVYLTIKGMLDEYECHLVTGKEIHLNIFEGLPGFTLHVCPYLVRPISPWNDLRALWWLYRLMRRERCLLVHTHETKASLLGRMAAWMARVPHIIYGLHGVTFNDPMSRARRLIYIWLERLTIWMNDYVISVSQDAWSHYVTNRIGTKLPAEVVYSGIDIPAFQASVWPDDASRAAFRQQMGVGPNDTLLINMGRFSFAKAQRYTIECLARLKDRFPRLKLLLVGEGELQADCRRQVKEAGLDDRVIFYGFESKVGKVLSAADISVLTSLREGLPRVVVEASLAGVATAAFDVEGLKEIITDGESGFIAASGDVEALTEKIAALAADAEKRRIFGTRAREHVMGKWGADTLVRKQKAIYQRLLNG